MTKKTLLKEIAYLEFVNDQLMSELSYVDELLREIGFPEGLKTVKSAAHELLKSERGDQEEESHESFNPSDDNLGSG